MIESFAHFFFICSQSDNIRLQHRVIDASQLFMQIFEFVIQKFYALRKPKTNIQILQQSVLLKYKYTIFSCQIPILACSLVLLFLISVPVSLNMYLCKVL
jgi:hypothetical protein